MLRAPEMDAALRRLVEAAIAEDLGGLPGAPGAIDQTVAAAISPTLSCRAEISARADGITCGLFLVAAILQYYHPGLTWTPEVADGQAVIRGQRLGAIAGPAGALLSAERVVLNFVGHLSGIATLTHRFVKAVEAAVEGERPVICDTRKTTPGWRRLEKYAVRCGGGVNHRLGLYDAVMLKDTHLAAWGKQSGPAQSLAELAAQVRAALPRDMTLWLEVESLEQLAAALAGDGPDIILLDNMTTQQMRQAVRMRRQRRGTRRPLLEASGGISLANVAAIARTGVDRISVGALTHSAPSLDVAMEVLFEPSGPGSPARLAAGEQDFVESPSSATSGQAGFGESPPSATC